MKSKVSITCAVTGGADNRSRNRHLPVTAEEIARDVADVAAAGATMVHIHVRDPDTGLESWKTDDFMRVVDLIRCQRTDIIINLTSAIGMSLAFDLQNPSRLDDAKTDFWAPERRLQHIRAARPDVCSLDVPIMNYGDSVYCNLPAHVDYIAREVQKIGVKPEIECFSPGDLWRTKEFIDSGIFDAPPLIQLCMGVKYGMPATTRAMVAMCDMLPQGAVWGAFGIGRDQMAMVAQSVILGGNVRVGLEDNLYLEKGVPATNAQLVQRAADIIERMGAQVATVAEARAELGLVA
ncbi:3-keto-5-aminohexanoate cleavage protein [Sphingosinicella sp.]|uniref:3-keto-5-aminohexanoate cleavage protein n=1 Tax=Sphingosinicella sp. TaxID=1917971 RepID=UPI0017DEAD04|nr:3-keto-5-aminohexanoate cleavage protein [Sphingosinicella sp.]MBA4760072.1 3-keto-5-aminohexanoate cleavage protein [Sphingosinicella sp.]